VFNLLDVNNDGMIDVSEFNFVLPTKNMSKETDPNGGRVRMDSYSKIHNQRVGGEMVDDYISDINKSWKNIID